MEEKVNKKEKKNVEYVIVYNGLLEWNVKHENLKVKRKRYPLDYPKMLIILL